MRNNVTFRHPAMFVPVSESDGVLSTIAAEWFVELLKRVRTLEVDTDLCQEDWGVVIFARRNRKRFWIGLSPWSESGFWLAHFHHHSFAWLQRLSDSGNREFDRLVMDFHDVLAAEPAVTQIAWYREKDMEKARPEGSSLPEQP
jgi:hypothetical protein